MGYIESNLLPGETVVGRAHLHWIVFTNALVVGVIGAALLFVLPVLGAVVVLLALAMAVPPFIELQTSEFGVTSKRVVIKVGFVRRRTVELLLRQVEAISVDQSFLGRILGFGSITITGTGGVREVFHRISSPLEFRRHVHSQTIAAS